MHSTFQRRLLLCADACRRLGADRLRKSDCSTLLTRGFPRSKALRAFNFVSVSTNDRSLFGAIQDTVYADLMEWHFLREKPTRHGLVVELEARPSAPGWRGIDPDLRSGKGKGSFLCVEEQCNCLGGAIVQTSDKGFASDRGFFYVTHRKTLTDRSLMC